MISAFVLAVVMGMLLQSEIDAWRAVRPPAWVRRARAVARPQQYALVGTTGTGLLSYVELDRYGAEYWAARGRAVVQRSGDGRWVPMRRSS